MERFDNSRARTPDLLLHAVPSLGSGTFRTAEIKAEPWGARPRQGATRIPKQHPEPRRQSQQALPSLTSSRNPFAFLCRCVFMKQAQRPYRHEKKTLRKRSSWSWGSMDTALAAVSLWQLRLRKTILTGFLEKHGEKSIPEKPDEGACGRCLLLNWLSGHSAVHCHDERPGIIPSAKTKTQSKDSKQSTRFIKQNARRGALSRSVLHELRPGVRRSEPPESLGAAKQKSREIEELGQLAGTRFNEIHPLQGCKACCGGHLFGTWSMGALWGLHRTV